MAAYGVFENDWQNGIKGFTANEDRSIPTIISTLLQMFLRLCICVCGTVIILCGVWKLEKGKQRFR